MAKDVKVIDLIDEDGYRMPGNLNTQSRNLQGGVEYLKDSADNITVELKTVSKKLGKHTTDLFEITKKVNEIDKNINELAKAVGENFSEISKMFDIVIPIVKSMTAHSTEAKPKNKETQKKKK